MRVEESQSSLENARGQNLATYAYVPDTVKAVLVFHHGFGEYCGRKGMPEVFRTWAAHGIAVHCYDAHGHGFSDPKDEYDRYLIWDFNHIVDDLVLFASTVKKLYSSKTPIFLGGHSMGSLASIHVALRDQAQWDGLVLGTATVDVEWSWTLRCQASVGSLLAVLIPRAKIVPASVDDTAEVAEPRIPTDPLLCAENVRCRTANELLKAFNHVQLYGHQLWLPIYCHHGTADKLASIQAISSLLNRCASPDISFHKIQDGPHELFLSKDSVHVTNLVADWITQHISQAGYTEKPCSPIKKNKSSISLASQHLWASRGSSPVGSVYGGSPRGCSPTAKSTASFFTENVPIQETA